MRRYLTYTFPAGNKTDVCAIQSPTAASNLNLNGNLSNGISQVNFLSKGYSRSISLNSTNDLSTVKFTIIGKQNGELITEEMMGPDGTNTTTKFSTEIYDVITSISVSKAANGISIGTGPSGYFPIININLESSIINYSLSTFKLTAASIPTSILNTLDNVALNGQSFSHMSNKNFFVIKSKSADDNYLLPAANVIPCNSIIVLIQGDPTTIDNSIRMNFIQV